MAVIYWPLKKDPPPHTPTSRILGLPTNRVISRKSPLPLCVCVRLFLPSFTTAVCMLCMTAKPQIPVSSSGMTATMLPHFETSITALYDSIPQAPKRLLFKMPRVVPDQKSKFESEDIFRRLARESEVRYTGYRDRPIDERRQRFQNGIKEGHTDIAFMTNGTNMSLAFGVNGFNNNHKDVDFDKEQGKVQLRSPFILNGVCVRWKGWIDLERLDGVGCLEFDEENAAEENRMLQEEIEKYKQRLREFDEKQQRAFRVPHSSTHGHAHHAHLNSAHHAHHAAAHANEQNNIQVR